MVNTGNTMKIGYDGKNVTVTPHPMAFLHSTDGPTITITADKALWKQGPGLAKNVKFSLDKLYGAQYFSDAPQGVQVLDPFKQGKETLTLTLQKGKNLNTKRDQGSTNFPHLIPPADPNKPDTNFTVVAKLTFVGLKRRSDGNDNDVHMEC